MHSGLPNLTLIYKLEVVINLLPRHGETKDCQTQVGHIQPSVFQVTCPDIADAVNQCAKLCLTPDLTTVTSLQLTPIAWCLTAYADTDHFGDPASRSSKTGHDSMIAFITVHPNSKHRGSVFKLAFSHTTDRSPQFSPGTVLLL